MVSVYPIGDEFYTLTEYPFMHRIDPKTLETIDRVRCYLFYKYEIVSQTISISFFASGNEDLIAYCNFYLL